MLTHWGRDKMAAIFQTTFSNAFSWMKMFEFRLKFHWSLFLWFQLTIFQHWFRYWLGAVQATSHYLNQWWLIYWRIYASLGLNELSHIWSDIFDQSFWKINYYRMSAAYTRIHFYHTQIQSYVTTNFCTFMLIAIDDGHKIMELFRTEYTR